MRGRTPFGRRRLIVLGIVAAVVGISAAAAFAALGDQGVIVCVKNSNGSVRVVSSESACTAQEHAEALAGPGSTVAEATHAQSADFADEAGDADTLDGADLTNLVRDYDRAIGVFGAPPGSIFFMNVTCARSANDTVFNFGAVTTNFGALDPPPIVLESGEHNPQFWQMYMQNRDPDTVAQMSFHGSCVTVDGSPSLAPEAAPADEPVLSAGTK
jgi:hypothetical protein